MTATTPGPVPNPVFNPEFNPVPNPVFNPVFNPVPNPVFNPVPNFGRLGPWRAVCCGVDGMSRSRVILGKIGEDLACQELARRGYAILARRYRRRGGELDIIARDGSTIVFVEVKTRDGLACGSGGEAITPLKQHRMAAVAIDFLARHRLLECACRFDVVAIDCSAAAPTIEVYENAFTIDV